MAKTIQVRDVPDDVHRRLRVQAAEAGKSLSAYVRDELETVAGRSEKVALFLRLVSEPSSGISTQETLDALDEGRNRRDRD